jgi:hypothetical protein
MKPFNLKEAIQGKLLISRDGKWKNMRISHININENTNYPFVVYGYIDATEEYTLTGHYQYYDQNNIKDLFMQEDSDLVEESVNQSLITEITESISEILQKRGLT